MMKRVGYLFLFGFSLNHLCKLKRSGLSSFLLLLLFFPLSTWNAHVCMHMYIPSFFQCIQSIVCLCIVCECVSSTWTSCTSQAFFLHYYSSKVSHSAHSFVLRSIAPFFKRFADFREKKNVLNASRQCNFARRKKNQKKNPRWNLYIYI